MYYRLIVLRYQNRERSTRHEEEKINYPLFGSSDDDRHDDGLFIVSQT
jgi:hypothetical protein